jgi:hypothetical protein
MKSNKLIAEFLGAKPISLGASVEYEMYGIIECIKDGVNEKHFFIPDEMEFKESWDWLMPVVETCYHNGAEENHIGDITHALLDCDLEYTYNAVVEFIKWYNKTKTSISFEHENKSYTIDYTNELKNGDDWWHSYKVKGVMFDLHYCEDYNEIVVYLPNNNNKVIARKEIK